MRDVEVLVVGAGPVGLMLAAELRLVGIRPLVVERQPRPQEIPRAGGLGGRVLDLLTCRGLIDRFEEASDRPHPALRFPFGGVYVDLTELADPPLRALSLPQARLERLLLERADELGVEIARGHAVVGLRQDDAGVVVDVRGPEGVYQVRAAYVVGCDGSKSSVRTLAGIDFPGTCYPEVHRLGHVTLPASVTLLDDGDLDIPGHGRLRQGFIQTARGTVGIAASAGVLLLSTVEEESQDYDDDSPLGLEEFRASARRVLGGEVPMGEPLRLSRWTFQARLAEQYRLGRVFVAGDAAHLFPATGAAISVGMLDAANLAWKLAADLRGWAPPALLDSYHEERHLAASRTMLQTQAQVALRRGHDGAADALREVVAELLRDEPAQRRLGAMIAGSDVPYPMPGRAGHPLVGTFAPDLPLVASRGPSSVAELMHHARPVLLDLADRSDLRDVARPWRHRVDIHTASAASSVADALLIRPDGWVAWAAPVDAPINSAGSRLVEALTTWFGTPPTDNAVHGGPAGDMPAEPPKPVTDPSADPEAALVLASYAAFARGDIESAVAPTDDRTEWVEPEEFPMGGRRTGRAAIAEYLTASRSVWAEFESRPVAYRVGEQIVVVHHVNGTLHDGTASSAKVADVYQVRDGRVVSMHATTDIDAALVTDAGRPERGGSQSA